MIMNILKKALKYTALCAACGSVLVMHEAKASCNACCSKKETTEVKQVATEEVTPAPTAEATAQ